MSDDEITRAADPEWLSELRAAATGDQTGDRASDEFDDAPLRGDEVPRFAEDLAAQDGVTLAGADIMEQVRQAVAAARATEQPPVEQASVEPAPFNPPHLEQAHVEQGHVDLAPGDLGPSTAASIAERPGARWSPPPRLKPGPTPQLPALLPPDTTSRQRRHVIAIAAVVLVAVGVLIGGLLRGGGGDSPSRDSVSVTSQVGGTTP